MKQLDYLFKTIINEAKDKLNQTSLFDDILLSCKPAKIINNNFYIVVDDLNKLNLYKTIDEDKLSNIISESLAQKLKLVFVSKNELLGLNTNIENNELENFNPNLTFDNYIQGEFNKTPVVLFQNILKQLISNTIFIYGSTGLGKTHLVTAFISEYMKKYPQKRVCYIDTVTFVAKTTNAIKSSGYIEEFKQNYSKYDLFVFEDVQNLNNKIKTNEILFTIYNNLITTNKLVIFTSDKNIDQLSNIDSRLISRFGSGFVLKIDAPDQQSLIKIFKLNLKQLKVKVLDDAIEMITRYFKNDIRRLLGFINSIYLLSAQKEDGYVITKNDVCGLLEINADNLGMEYNPVKIINLIADYYKTPVHFITGLSRKKNIANIRHIAIYIIRKKTMLQYNVIGQLFSNRDHSTIMSSESKIEKQLETDQELKKVIDHIFTML